MSLTVGERFTCLEDIPDVIYDVEQWMRSSANRFEITGDGVDGAESELQARVFIASAEVQPRVQGRGGRSS